MKQAYVSVVLVWEPGVERATIERIDAALGAAARAHEIVVVVPPTDEAEPALAALRAPGALTAPLSLVTTWHGTGTEAALVAGLTRAAGDFVLEWSATPEDLSPEVLADVLRPTDEGFEIVEVVPVRSPLVSRAFFRLANAFRPRTAPLRPAVARLYSRRALDLALSAGRALPNRSLMVAGMGLPRTTLTRDLRHRAGHGYRARWGEALTVLTRGTRAASIVPAVGAFVLAMFSLGAAIFAVVHLFVTGRAPEGWTTLMVLVGLGLSGILAFLGLLWERVDGLARTIEHPHDATANVVVVPPLRASGSAGAGPERRG